MPRCKTVYVHNEYNDGIVKDIPGIHAKYHGFIAGKGHVETVCALLCRKAPLVQYRRTCITCAPDGGVVALDWFYDREQSLPPTAPVMIMMAGFTGGSQDPYMGLAALSAREVGYRAVVVLARGCGGSPVTTPRMFSASDTGDLRQAIAHVHQLYPEAPLLAVGWSAGGNRLVHYLAEEGSDTPLSAGMSLCNIWSLVYGDTHWMTGIHRQYDKFLTRKCIRQLKAHEAIFIDNDKGIDLEAGYRAETLREYDKAVTVPMFGHASVAEYYQKGSSNEVLHRVRIPLMCVNALDDPLAPHQAIPYKTFEQNPHTILVTTPTGGHLGWMSGPGAPFKNPWTDYIMIAFFEGVLKRLGQTGRPATVSNGGTAATAGPHASDPAGAASTNGTHETAVKATEAASNAASTAARTGHPATTGDGPEAVQAAAGETTGSTAAAISTSRGGAANTAGPANGTSVPPQVGVHRTSTPTSAAAAADRPGGAVGAATAADIEHGAQAAAAGSTRQTGDKDASVVNGHEAAASPAE